MNRLHAFLTASPLLLGLVLPGAVCAQAWPAKPVRIVVPFPPATGIDITLRLFTPKVSEALGQQFIADYRTGASGTIGAAIAARAAPDGYTLLAASSSLASSQSLYKALSYDLAHDFEPIALFASSPFLLVVHPSLPVKNVKELIALAKARRGELSFSSNGNGSSLHLTGELLKMQTGIEMLHVPYKGGPQALSDVIAGQVSMMFINPLSVLPHVETGRVRAIATSGASRSAIVPNLPTVAESGLPEFESGTWWSLLAPTGTPREIVTHLNAVVAKVGRLPEVRDRLIALGAEPRNDTPEQFGAYVRSEIVKWGKVIAAARVQPN